MKYFVVYRAQLLVHANFDIDSLVPRNILMQMLLGIQVNIFWCIKLNLFHVISHSYSVVADLHVLL